MPDYRPLFTLRCTHAYYGGACPDFRFVLPAETATRLRNGRLVAREQAGTLHVLFEAEGATPRVRLTGATLRVGLQLAAPFFGNYTQLPPTFPQQRLRYTNAAVPGALGIPQSVAVDALDDPELRRMDLAALVEVTVADAFYGNGGAPAFVVDFAARQEPLRYYVIARGYSATEVGQFQVADLGFATDGRPEVQFTRVTPSAFSAAEQPMAALATGDERMVLFRSQSVLTRRVVPRRGLQLTRQNDVLVAHLPHPGADRAAADMVVHVAKVANH